MPNHFFQIKQIAEGKERPTITDPEQTYYAQVDGSAGKFVLNHYYFNKHQRKFLIGARIPTSPDGTFDMAAWSLKLTKSGCLEIIAPTVPKYGFLAKLPELGATKCIVDGLEKSMTNISPRYLALVSFYLRGKKDLSPQSLIRFMSENGTCDSTQYPNFSDNELDSLKVFSKAPDNFRSHEMKFFKMFGVNPRVTNRLSEISSGAILSSKAIDQSMLSKGFFAPNFSACHSQMMMSKERNAEMIQGLSQACGLESSKSVEGGKVDVKATD